MTEAEVAAALGLEAIHAGEGTREIKGIYAGDLLSRVMSHAKAGNFWVTIMANPNVVAVAMLVDAGMVVLAEGVEPEPAAAAAAKAKGIALYRSEKPAAELCIAAAAAGV
ncbi:MAG: hypothetical protein IJS32_01390 [Kiritimatiellae bacterium]|nr:hypothetical protein [Kiritimatiellia bacterium]